MQAFPEAKIILTAREPDAWYESARNTIYSTVQYWVNPVMATYAWIKGTNKTYRMIKRLAYKVPRVPGFDMALFHALEAGRKEAVAFYEAWAKDAVETVEDKGRLLVFDVRDGWEPLCEFLGVPAPAEAFPRTNDTREYRARTEKSQKEAQLIVFAIPFVILFLITVIGAFVLLTVAKYYS